MNTLFRLAVLAVVGLGVYFYFVEDARPEWLTKVIAKVANQPLFEKPATAKPAAKPASVKVSSEAPPPPKPADMIKLKNGKTIVGNIVIRDPEITWIRTPDGKTTQVKTEEIVSVP